MTVLVADGTGGAWAAEAIGSPPVTAPRGDRDCAPDQTVGVAPGLPAGVPAGEAAAVAPGLPAGLAVAPDGTIVVSDGASHVLRYIDVEGTWRVVGGSARGVPGTTRTQLRRPSGVAFAPDGTWVVADTGNDRIRTVGPDGRVATLAGSGYGFGDGHGSAARFRRPQALVVDDDGSVLVADTGNHAIRRITPDGDVITLAGSPVGGDQDGVGADVGLRWPTDLTLADDGALWVADQGNGAVRRIDHTGAATTILRCSGRRWPGAVARAPDGRMIVAVAVLDDPAAPRTQLISLGSGR
jgi:sugar lactone lactonase YvrE